MTIEQWAWIGKFSVLFGVLFIFLVGIILLLLSMEDSNKTGGQGW